MFRSVAVVLLLHAVLASSSLVGNTLDTKAAEIHGRDFSGFYTTEEDKKLDYHSLTYPPSYQLYPVRDGPPAPECPPNPLMPLFNNGLNFLLLKLGAIGIVKVISALLFLGLIVKIPIFLVKFAFLKAFLLPMLVAPLLLLYSHTQNMMSPMRPTEGDKPADSSDSSTDTGRRLDELSDTVWRSARMVATSDRCLERISCTLGAYNNHTIPAQVFRRMTKYIQFAAPPTAQVRIRAIQDAFQHGSDNGECTALVYPCRSPEIILRQGSSTISLV